MNRFLSILLFIICIAFVIASVCYVNFVKTNEVLSVFSNTTSNIDFFIKNIENIVLSVYDVDITGEKLSSSQKEFITKMYILRNRAMFQNVIKDGDVPSIDINSFNLAYTYLFGESYISGTSIVELGTLNVERFIPSSREIVSFESNQDSYRVKVIYTAKFESKLFKYTVSYNIGSKGGMYFLIGFNIEKNGDE